MVPVAFSLATRPTVLGGAERSVSFTSAPLRIFLVLLHDSGDWSWLSEGRTRHKKSFYGLSVFLQSLGSLMDASLLKQLLLNCVQLQKDALYLHKYLSAHRATDCEPVQFQGEGRMIIMK